MKIPDLNFFYDRLTWIDEAIDWHNNNLFFYVHVQSEALVRCHLGRSLSVNLVCLMFCGYYPSSANHPGGHSISTISFFSLGLKISMAFISVWADSHCQFHPCSHTIDFGLVITQIFCTITFVLILNASSKALPSSTPELGIKEEQTLCISTSAYFSGICTFLEYLSFWSNRYRYFVLVICGLLWFLRV